MHSSGNLYSLTSTTGIRKRDGCRISEFPWLSLSGYLSAFGSFWRTIVFPIHSMPRTACAQRERPRVLAGGVSALVAGAVNGPTMLQTLSQGGDGGGGVLPGDGSQNHGGRGDNPDTEFNGGQGPGEC